MSLKVEKSILNMCPAKKIFRKTLKTKSRNNDAKSTKFEQERKKFLSNPH